MYKTTRPYVNYDPVHDDSRAVSVHVKCDAAQRKWLLRNVGQLSQALQADDVFIPTRCDCTHCMNDWDCCGNWTGSYVAVKPTRRGLTVTQHQHRNI